MKLAGLPVFLFIVFCVSAALVRNISSNVFQYSLFNVVILFIIFGSYRPSIDEANGILPSLIKSTFEDAEDTNNDVKCDSDDNENKKGNDEVDDAKKYVCPDGCAGYNSDSGSDGEVERQDDDEELDENLNKRIEDFISKVTQRWREERLTDQFHWDSHGSQNPS